MNADPCRGKRFDLLFNEFIEKNQLINTTIRNENHTYENGEYRSNLDHILVNKDLENQITSNQIINDNLDLSDHRPIALSLKIESSVKDQRSSVEMKQFHKFA